MFTITTHIGRVGLTDFGMMDSNEWLNVEAGSVEFFEDAHQVFYLWLDSGDSQDQYFGTDYFILTNEQKAILNRE